MLLVEEDRLPGWEAVISADPKISTWMNDLTTRIGNAIRDEDAVRFDQELSSVTKAWRRVNELVAEAYRLANKDPELWELRYIKWMKIAFVKFDSPLGEFFVVPRLPTRRPKARYWYTVDEMIALIRSPVAELIQLSGKLPERPEVLQPPGLGEQVLHIDATGPTVRTYYELHKARRPRYG